MPGSLEMKRSERDNSLCIWYTTAGGELFFIPITAADVDMAKQKMADFLASDGAAPSSCTKDNSKPKA